MGHALPATSRARYKPHPWDECSCSTFACNVQRPNCKGKSLNIERAINLLALLSRSEARP